MEKKKRNYNHITRGNRRKITMGELKEGGGEVTSLKFQTNIKAEKKARAVLQIFFPHLICTQTTFPALLSHLGTTNLSHNLFEFENKMSCCRCCQFTEIYIPARRLIGIRRFYQKISRCQGGTFVFNRWMFFFPKTFPLLFDSFYNSPLVMWGEPLGTKVV